MQYEKITNDTFRLSGVDKSFANAIRRTLLGNIPILVLKPADCTITSNTTRFTNEIIKARLACIPLHHKNLKDSFTVDVSKKNDTADTLYITTKDFTVNSKHSPLFPSYTILDGVKEHIEFIRLRAGEELILTGNSSIGTANESGMYNSVGTCAYGFTQDRVKSNAMFEKSGKSEKDRGDWECLDAKRFVVKDSFDFVLKTIGVYSNLELLQLSTIVIRSQLEHCKMEIESSPSITTIENCFDVVITGNYTLGKNKFEMQGDYTIGKLLEYQIYTRFNHPITYVAFYKKHPHDKVGILRVAFPGATSETIKECVEIACNECISAMEHFKTIIESK
jgi:DNA-directed RNA polymerase subunit L